MGIGRLWTHSMFLLLVHSRLQPHESYFNVFPPKVDDKNILFATTCSCNNGKVERCGKLNQILREMDARAGMETDTNVARIPHKNKRNVRTSDDLEDDDHVFFSESPVPSASHHAHWRSKREAPLSSENATKHCKEKLVESHVGKICTKLGLEMHALVESCALDLAVSILSYKKVGEEKLLDQSIHALYMSGVV